MHRHQGRVALAKHRALEGKALQQLTFYQIDAFTKVPFTGNACAVVMDSLALDEQTMLAVAREFNLSETAFVGKSEKGDFAARYFTPDEEIPLAGHPTIATAFALVHSGRFRLKGEVTPLFLALKAGIIRVDLNRCADGLGRIDMYQNAPVFGRNYSPEMVMPVFGLTVADHPKNAPIQTVSTGTPQLMIQVKDLETLRRARLDISAYVSLRAEGDFFSPHLFCLEGIDERGRTFARHFGTPPDILEDPFTGSATGGMAAYLWHYRLLSGREFLAQQGHDLNRPGQAQVGLVGRPDAIESVRVSGHAVKVIEGKLWV